MADPWVIAAGELRHKIQIQKPSATRDAAGQPIPIWDLLLNTRAKIENTNSRTFRESFSANALASQSTDVITIRWPGSAFNIKPGMRVLHGDDYFLIQAVDNVQRRNRKVVLLCIGINTDSNAG
jgi:SPP1 family predicted phage head-tail adaptor